MREKSYKECLAEHFSDLKFVLENGTLDEKAAVLGPILVMADIIEKRTGRKAPGITFEQAEKYSMAGNKSVKESLEKQLYFFLRDVINHAKKDDLRCIEASIPKNDMSLYPLELIIQGITGLDYLKTYTFLNTKMPVVQQSKVIDFKKWVYAKEVSNGTE